MKSQKHMTQMIFKNIVAQNDEIYDEELFEILIKNEDTK